MDEFVSAVETVAPPGLACAWDNSGLLLRCGESVERVLIALDATMAVADEAIDDGFDMILAHHPTLFTPVKALDHRHSTDAVLMKLIQAGISLYAAHTTFDKAEGGINDMLANRLGLTDTVMAAGPEDGLMRVGKLPRSLDVSAFAEHVKRVLDTDAVHMSEYCGKTVCTVAVLGGSGGDFAAAAKAAGADALVTGEAKHHHFLEAAALELLLIEAGHYATEHGFVDEIFMSLQSRLNELQLQLYLKKANCEKAPCRTV
jgi:dinuclear metal center YbgI/SA1388 family protein